MAHRLADLAVLDGSGDRPVPKVDIVGGNLLHQIEDRLERVPIRGEAGNLESLEQLIERFGFLAVSIQSLRVAAALLGHTGQVAALQALADQQLPYRVVVWRNAQHGAKRLPNAVAVPYLLLPDEQRAEPR